MKKRIVSLFLAALMIAALVPTAAFAADDAGVMGHPVHTCIYCGGELTYCKTVLDIDPDSSRPCTHGSGRDYDATKTERWYCGDCGNLGWEEVVATGTYCANRDRYYWD